MFLNGQNFNSSSSEIKSRKTETTKLRHFKIEPTIHRPSNLCSALNGNCLHNLRSFIVFFILILHTYTHIRLIRRGLCVHWGVYTWKNKEKSYKGIDSNTLNLFKLVRTKIRWSCHPLLNWAALICHGTKIPNLLYWELKLINSVLRYTLVEKSLTKIIVKPLIW